MKAGVRASFDEQTCSEREAGPERWGNCFEVKRRAKRVKEELGDIADAAKDVLDQAGDIGDAVKGKPRKGRKPRAKKATK